MDTVLNIQALPPAVAAGGIALFFIKEYVANQQRSNKSTSSSPPPPPEVAGLPVIGNLLQLKEKKPHKTFTKWAEKYGPIYSIKAGSTSMVVLNSKDVAKEAMVTKYSSISTRKMTNALKILSWDKGIVALSDYNDFHKVAKRHLLTSSLGPDAQKRQRIHRDAMMNNICLQFHAHAEAHPSQPVNFRKIFQSEIFRFSLKQAIGEDVESIYMEELGRCLSREEIYKILVIDPMEGAIDVDWRDLFPFFNWIPNPDFENRLHNMFFRREVVMKALIHHHKECVASGKEMEYCYLSHLLSEGADKLTEGQILSLVWEDIIEAADTTLITMEWAMYQLSKHPHKQDRLLSEIQNACGSDQLTEEKLCKLPYLAAVFHETLRKHSPVPVVPLRYVHQDTELGGYKIPQGTQIAINIYGCNMDKKVWESPEEWMPERFAKDNGCMELHKTMAFGLGKRVCAGAQQAMTVSCMAIGRLVQEFQWQLGDGEEEKVDTVGLTTHKLHPLLTIITPRLKS